MFLFPQESLACLLFSQSLFYFPLYFHGMELLPTSLFFHYSTKLCMIYEMLRIWQFMSYQQLCIRNFFLNVLKPIVKLYSTTSFKMLMLTRMNYTITILLSIICYCCAFNNYSSLFPHLVNNKTKLVNRKSK